MKTDDLTDNQRKNADILNEFTLWREHNDAPSEETRKTDAENITQFLQVYGDKDIILVAKSDVTKYLTYLTNYKWTPRVKKGQPPKPSKKYAETTKFNKRKCLKVFLNWLHDEYNTADLTSMITLKKAVKERVVSKPLDYDDLLKLVEGCRHTRDKAMLAFLLDSGVRRSELLSIKYGNISFTDEGVIVMVPPKKNATEYRRVYCVWCSQFMHEWYREHFTKKADDYFFCSLREPYGKFTKTGLWAQLQKIARRAGFEEHIYTHLFRYSSATIFCQMEGMTAYKINKRYGWKLSSAMADVYINLSGKESDDDINKAFDKPVGQRKVKGKTLIKCPKCKLDNYITNERCYNCEKALSPEEIAKEKTIEESKKKAEEAEMNEKITLLANQIVEKKIEEQSRAMDKMLIDLTRSQLIREFKSKNGREPNAEEIKVIEEEVRYVDNVELPVWDDDDEKKSS